MLLCRSPGKCIKEQRRRVTLEGYINEIKKILMLEEACSSYREKEEEDTLLEGKGQPIMH